MGNCAAERVEESGLPFNLGWGREVRFGVRRNHGTRCLGWVCAGMYVPLRAGGCALARSLRDRDSACWIGSARLGRREGRPGRRVSERLFHLKQLPAVVTVRLSMYSYFYSMRNAFQTEPETERDLTASLSQPPAILARRMADDGLHSRSD